MNGLMIHPTAIVEEGVELGAGCVVHAGAILRRGTVLGDGVVVHPYAVVGGDPQDLRFDPTTPSGVRIGAATVIREYVTIHRSTHAGGMTEVGARCFLMVSSHVGHDTRVGDGAVLANAVLLAGHVTVGANCFLGGGAGIHQHCRIGEGVMVSGLSRIAQDIAPFVMAAERNEIIGLNLVGLRRRGVSREAIRELKAAFRAVYIESSNPRAAAAALLDKVQSAEAKRFLEFFASPGRGFARARRGGAEERDEQAGTGGAA